MNFSYDFISEYTVLAQSDENKAIEWIYKNKNKLGDSTDEFVVNVLTRNKLYNEVFQDVIYVKLKEFINRSDYDSNSAMCYNFLTNLDDFSNYKDIEDYLLKQDNNYSVQYILTKNIDISYDIITKKVKNILDKCKTDIKFMPLYNTVNKMNCNNSYQEKLQKEFNWEQLKNEICSNI